MSSRMLLRAAAIAAIAVLACAGLSSGCIIYLNPLCTDQIRNGEETDIDCGGTCGKCDLGGRCGADADCDEGTCKGGTCAPLPCANGVQDGEETDVDCGGDTCRKCAGGRTCEAATDCFNGMCVGTPKACDELKVVSFGPAVSFPSGNKAYILLSSDFNGDGSIDLAAGNELDSEMRVFLNNGAGTFQRVATAFPTGDYSTGGVIADFNKDGIPDVVTADYHGNSVSILLGINNGMGKGTGSLAPKSTFPTIEGAETSNLAVGDLNRDGNLDVIATNPQTSSVSRFMGRGDGTLDPAINVPVGIEGSAEPYSVAIGDFNLDGNNDVAIANVRNGTLIVRLGNGDGTFQDEVPYVEGGTPPYILITHDVDVDGKLDLVCANRASNDVSVLLGRGDGTFRKAVVSRTGPEDGPDTGPYAITVADFNRDGVPDVATPNYLSSTASVLLGIGNGGFEEPIDVGTTGETSYGIVAADLNGDGKIDLAISNAISNDVTVKLSTAQ